MIRVWYDAVVVIPSRNFSAPAQCAAVHEGNPLNVKVTNTEIKQVRQALVNAGVSDISAASIRRVCKLPGRRSRTLFEKMKAEVSEPTEQPDTTCDDKFAAYREFIGWNDRHIIMPRPRKSTEVQKIVVCGDPHAPFHDMGAISEMISREATDTDLLILNGDFLDLNNWSRHDKFYVRYSPKQELAESQALLNLLASKFQKIVMLPGNHDERWVKALVARGVPADILDAYRSINPEFLSPLHLMAKALSNVEVAEPKPLGDYARFGWFYQVGDLITTHAETYSKIPNRAVGSVIHWLQSYALPQSLVQPFKVVIQNHTHQAGVTYNDFGVWGVENGCLCQPGDYVSSPKMAGAPRPWIKGYTVLNQVYGVTDIQSLRFIPLSGL